MVTRTFPKMSQISFYKDSLNAYVARRFKFKEFPANFASIPKQIKNSLTFKNNKSLIHMQTSQQSRPGETFSIQVGTSIWVCVIFCLSNWNKVKLCEKMCGVKSPLSPLVSDRPAINDGLCLWIYFDMMTAFLHLLKFITHLRFAATLVRKKC